MNGSSSLLAEREVIMGRMVWMKVQVSELQLPVTIRTTFLPSGQNTGVEDVRKSVVFSICRSSQTTIKFSK